MITTNWKNLVGILVSFVLISLGVFGLINFESTHITGAIVFGVVLISLGIVELSRFIGKKNLKKLALAVSLALVVMMMAPFVNASITSNIQEIKSCSHIYNDFGWKITFGYYAFHFYGVQAEQAKDQMISTINQEISDWYWKGAVGAVAMAAITASAPVLSVLSGAVFPSQAYQEVSNLNNFIQQINAGYDPYNANHGLMVITQLTSNQYLGYGYPQEKIYIWNWFDNTPHLAYSINLGTENNYNFVYAFENTYNAMAIPENQWCWR